MKKRKVKIIKDPKKRGEWVESVFMARAAELGFAVSKPWGDSRSYDFVVGRPGRFVSVQVKSTTFEMGGGYMCTVRKNNQRYKPGSFDFLAAYVIPEDVWYIIPAEKFAGRATLILDSNSGEAKYEEYREAWALLRDAVETGAQAAGEPEAANAEAGALEAEAAASQFSPFSAFGRMERMMKEVRDRLTGGGVVPRKSRDEV